MFSQLSAALLLLAPVNAFWILTHGPLTYDRLDPIVNPGEISTHVHSVIGGNAFKQTMDYATTQTSDCSTAPVQADKSSYWSPTLYHRSQNGTFSAIPVSFVQTYYLQRDGPTQKKIVGFPEGLRMVAGSATRTSYNSSNMEDRAINFVCLDYDSKTNDAGPQSTFPQRPCKDGMRMQVNFPSCWDGVNLDSADHKSHMSYPIGAPDSGDCPKSHPVKTILLFNEYVYDVGKFDYEAGQDSWVLATGDPTGLAFHADFIMGWDPKVLDAAVEQCTGQLFGDLEKCSPFLASLDRSKASKCKKEPLVEENALNPGRLLPGCNKYTPGRAPGAAGFCPNLAIPAIRGGPGASTMTASSASSSSAAASTSSAHSASSSSAAASSASGTKASTGSAAATSAVSSAASSATKSSGTVVASSSSAEASTAASHSASASTHKAHHHHHTKSVHLNPTAAHPTGSAPHASATAIAGSGNISNNSGNAGSKSGSTCKRDAAHDAKRQASAEAKYKRAVRAHHSGIKNRMSANY